MGDWYRPSTQSAPRRVHPGPRRQRTRGCYPDADLDSAWTQLPERLTAVEIQLRVGGTGIDFGPRETRLGGGVMRNCSSSGCGVGAQIGQSRGALCERTPLRARNASPPPRMATHALNQTSNGVRSSCSEVRAAVLAVRSGARGRIDVSRRKGDSQRRIPTVAEAPGVALGVPHGHRQGPVCVTGGGLKNRCRSDWPTGSSNLSPSAFAPNPRAGGTFSALAVQEHAKVGRIRHHGCVSQGRWG